MEEGRSKLLKVKKCKVCGAQNSLKNSRCVKCNLPLSISNKAELREKLLFSFFITLLSDMENYEKIIRALKDYDIRGVRIDYLIEFESYYLIIFTIISEDDFRIVKEKIRQIQEFSDKKPYKFLLIKAGNHISREKIYGAELIDMTFNFKV
jgi:ribosomal protein L40E